VVESADIVIIGGGVIGLSSAYHLAKAGAGKIVLLERQQLGAGSSGKSAAMLSLQFCRDAATLAMARRAYSRYMAFGEELGVAIDFHPTGWLSLATDGSAAALRQQAALLQQNGVATELLDAEEVAYRYPALNVDDIVLATFGPDDGPFDPHMIMQGYARRVRALSVQILEGVQATGIRFAGEPGFHQGRVTGVATDHGFIAAGIAVNVAGPWAGEVARWAGVELPLRNAARTIVVTGPTPAIPADYPFVEDLEVEWYLRPELDGVLMGMGDRPAPPDYAGLDEEQVEAIIERAVHRAPALEDARLQTAWTGIRPLTESGQPIVGSAGGPDGFLCNCGWGGVGLIMAPVAGEMLLFTL
jgi:sarcosine oxidase, subunit beta